MDDRTERDKAFDSMQRGLLIMGILIVIGGICQLLIDLKVFE
jgi:hypothetical protein